MHQSVTFRFQNFSNRFDGICINFEREKLISRKVSVAVLKKNWYRKKYRYRFQKSTSIGLTWSRSLKHSSTRSDRSELRIEGQIFAHRTILSAMATKIQMTLTCICTRQSLFQ